MVLWRPTRPFRTNTQKRCPFHYRGLECKEVGSQETPGVTGKFGLGIQNEAGQRLIEFCQENALVITNTVFFPEEINESSFQPILTDHSWSIPGIHSNLSGPEAPGSRFHLQGCFLSHLGLSTACTPSCSQDVICSRKSMYSAYAVFYMYPHA